MSQVCRRDPSPGSGTLFTGTGTLSLAMRTLCLHPEPSPPGTGTLFPGSCPGSTAQIPRWRAAALRRQVIPSSITAWKSGIISRQVALNPDERAAGMFHPLPSLRSIPCSASTWDGIETSIPPRRGVGSPPLGPPSLCPRDEAGAAKGRWDLGHGRRAPGAVDPQVPPSRLHAPAWIRAGSRGDLWRAAGKEGQRRRKQAPRLHLVTRSRGCVPVPRSSPRPPRIQPPQDIPSQPAQGPHTAPQGWERARSSERLRVFN